MAVYSQCFHSSSDDKYMILFGCGRTWVLAPTSSTMVGTPVIFDVTHWVAIMNWNCTFKYVFFRRISFHSKNLLSFAGARSCKWPWAWLEVTDDLRIRCDFGSSKGANNGMSTSLHSKIIIVNHQTNNVENWRKNEVLGDVSVETARPHPLVSSDLNSA